MKVHYMADIHGKRFVVASTDAPVGYLWNDVIYDTPFEAARAEGELRQHCYFDECLSATQDALAGILNDIDPPNSWDWDVGEEQRAAHSKLARDILEELFPPKWRVTKTHYATSFVEELIKTADVYKEMNNGS